MYLKQEGKTSIPKRLRQFNLKEPVKELKFNTIVINIKRMAPIL